MLALPPFAFGEEVEPPVAPPARSMIAASAMSSSRRFIAIGGTSIENVDLSGWAEDVADECTDTMGRPPFFRPGTPLVITLRETDEAGEGGVVKAQGYVDGRLRQKLIIYNIENVDHEDILEGLCWLLANRYAIALQDTEERKDRLAEAPDWLAVGLAQNLYSVLRARNNRIAFHAWRQGEAPSLEALLSLDVMPAGRWIEKACAGVAFAWLNSLPRADERFSALFRQLAKGDRVTAGWLAKEFVAVPSERDMEQNWELWLAHRQMIRTEWGSLTSRDIANLQAMHIVSADLFHLVTGKDAAGPIALEELALHRDEPWMPKLATFLGLKVKNLAVGRAAEYREVVGRYAAYLDALAEGRPRGMAKLLKRGRRIEDLQAMLTTAHAALAQLEEQARVTEADRASVYDDWQSLSAGTKEPRDAHFVLPGIKLVPKPR